MINESKSIAVVYLAWLPYGIGYLEKFVESYNTYNAGAEHQLLIVFNGKKQSNDFNQFLYYAQAHLPKFEYLEMDEGQDIDAYFFAAKNTICEYILFLNTYSRFNAEGWLLKFIHSFTENKYGLIGATASKQSLYNTVFLTHKWIWEFKKGIRFNIKKYKQFLKTAFYWSFIINKFPNPHIRTSAFMIPRDLFLTIKMQVLERKFDAYLFESGKKSLTNQVLDKGWEIGVIGKDGIVYKRNEWESSNVFWINIQENLLISDNQTDLYINATLEYKKYLTLIAWGIK